MWLKKNGVRVEARDAVEVAWFKGLGYVEEKADAPVEDPEPVVARVVTPPVEPEPAPVELPEALPPVEVEVDPPVAEKPTKAVKK